MNRWHSQLAGLFLLIAVSESGAEIFRDSVAIGGPRQTYTTRPAFDGFVTRNGLVFGVRDRKTYPLGISVILTNNLRVDADGTVTDGNGRVAHIAEDQMVTVDGQIESTPPGVDTLEAVKDYALPTPR